MIATLPTEKPAKGGSVEDHEKDQQSTHDLGVGYFVAWASQPMVLIFNQAVALPASWRFQIKD